MAKVKDANGKLLFDGREEDAYTFVENNFPHIHIDQNADPDEPPVAMAVLIDDAGVQRAYVGSEWEDVNYESDRGRFVHRSDPRPSKAVKSTTPGKEK